MIEPEIAFCDLNNNMDCAEGYLRHCFRYVLEECADDLAFLEDFEEKRKADAGEVDTEAKLRERLEVVANNDFGRISYTEAIEIVSKVWACITLTTTLGCAPPAVPLVTCPFLALPCHRTPCLLTCGMASTAPPGARPQGGCPMGVPTEVG